MASGGGQYRAGVQRSALTAFSHLRTAVLPCGGFRPAWLSSSLGVSRAEPVFFASTPAGVVPLGTLCTSPVFHLLRPAWHTALPCGHFSLSTASPHSRAEARPAVPGGEHHLRKTAAGETSSRRYEAPVVQQQRQRRYWRIDDGPRRLMRALLRAGTLRARCKLWAYLGSLLVLIATMTRPPGKNKSYPGASGIYWQPNKKAWEDRSCACTQAFLGFCGLFGWVHLGRSATDAAPTRCARGTTTPTMAGLRC